MKGNAVGPSIAAIVIWTFADFIIYPIVYSKFGPEWPAVALRIVISGGIGFLLLYLIIGAFGTVELQNEESAP